MIALDVTIPGMPKAQGSMRHVGGGRMIHAPELIAWRASVTSHLIAAIVKAERRDLTLSQNWSREVFPLTGPVDLSCTFHFPRPASHFRTGRFANLRRDVAPRYMQVAPDLDKLVRAVGDALTAACAIVDDKQIHLIHAAKSWLDERDAQPYATITLWNGEDHR